MFRQSDTYPHSETAQTGNKTQFGLASAAKRRTAKVKRRNPNQKGVEGDGWKREEDFKHS